MRSGLFFMRDLTWKKNIHYTEQHKVSSDRPNIKTTDERNQQLWPSSCNEMFCWETLGSLHSCEDHSPKHCPTSSGSPNGNDPRSRTMGPSKRQELSRTGLKKVKKELKASTQPPNFRILIWLSICGISWNNFDSRTNCGYHFESWGLPHGASMGWLWSRMYHRCLIGLRSGEFGGRVDALSSFVRPFLCIVVLWGMLLPIYDTVCVSGSHMNASTDGFPT